LNETVKLIPTKALPKPKQDRCAKAALGSAHLHIETRVLRGNNFEDFEGPVRRSIVHDEHASDTTRSEDGFNHRPDVLGLVEDRDYGNAPF